MFRSRVGVDVLVHGTMFHHGTHTTPVKHHWFVFQSLRQLTTNKQPPVSRFLCLQQLIGHCFNFRFCFFCCCLCCRTFSNAWNEQSQYHLILCFFKKSVDSCKHWRSQETRRQTPYRTVIQNQKYSLPCLVLNEDRPVNYSVLTESHGPISKQN